MKHSHKLLLLLSAMLALTACSKQDKFADLKQYVAQINARPAQQVPPLPETKLAAAYRITSTDLRNPFMPEVSKSSLQNRPDAGRPRQSLEKYSLDAIKMVGTVQVGNTLWALVQSPNGLQRVTIGQYIGQNSGKIIAISATAISVQETLPSDDDQWQQRIVKLELN